MWQQNNIQLPAFKQILISLCMQFLLFMLTPEVFKAMNLLKGYSIDFQIQFVFNTLYFSSHIHVFGFLLIYRQPHVFYSKLLYCSHKPTTTSLLLWNSPYHTFQCQIKQQRRQPINLS